MTTPAKLNEFNHAEEPGPAVAGAVGLAKTSKLKA